MTEQERSERAWDEKLDSETKRMRLLTAGFAGGLANMMLMIGAVVGGRGPEKTSGPIVTLLWLGALFFLAGFVRSINFNRLKMMRARAAFRAALSKEERDRADQKLSGNISSEKILVWKEHRKKAQDDYDVWTRERDSYDQPIENIYVWMEKTLRLAAFYAVILIFFTMTELGKSGLDDISRLLSRFIVIHSVD